MPRATAQPHKTKSATAQKKPAKKVVSLAEMEKVDPRQEKMLSYFLDPESPTFRNGRGSAIRAGYSENYADQLIARMPSWLGEVRIEDEDYLGLVDANLKELLTLPSQTQAMGAFGPIFAKEEKKVKVKLKNGKFRERKVVEKIPIFVHNKGLLDLKQKTTHFVAETIGRKRFSKMTTRVGFNFNIREKVDKDRQAYA